MIVFRSGGSRDPGNMYITMDTSWKEGQQYQAACDVNGIIYLYDQPDHKKIFAFSK